MLSVDVRFDGRTVEIFNEKSGVLDIRHDVTRIKPGAPDNPLLLPFNAFIPSADKSKGATLSWTDLMSGGLVESAIAEVIPCQGRAGETDAGTIPKARLFAMECKYIIYFDDAHKLLTTIEAYSNKTAKQIELIKLTYADYLYKGATVYFPTYANVAINNEDGSPLVKEEWKVGKIDIDVPVNTDMFSMDYQGARYVDDLDTGQWIKSPNLSEADLAKAVAEVVHPPQLPTVAPGTANSEDSSFTYYTTASLLIVAAVGAAIYLRRRLLPTSK